MENKYTIVESIDGRQFLVDDETLSKCEIQMEAGNMGESPDKTRASNVSEPAAETSPVKTKAYSRPRKIKTQKKL